MTGASGKGSVRVDGAPGASGAVAPHLGQQGGQAVDGADGVARLRLQGTPKAVFKILGDAVGPDGAGLFPNAPSVFMPSVSSTEAAFRLMAFLRAARRLPTPCRP